MDSIVAYWTPAADFCNTIRGKNGHDADVTRCLLMIDCVEKVWSESRIAFRSAGIFRIRIQDQLGREMAFSAT